MSTGQQHQFDLSFERINAHIRRIDIPALITATAVESQPDRGKRLIAAYAAIRPILVALSAVPMIPSIWRTALPPRPRHSRILPRTRSTRTGSMWSKCGIRSMCPAANARICSNG